MRPKQILIRADASVAIGTGHIIRCKTLADELRQHQAQVTFATRTLPGDLNAWLESEGYPLIQWEAAQADAVPSCLQTVLNQNHWDWLIVDHYELDAEWERQLQPQVEQIMVIDDLANRPHHCHILLDQNDLNPESKRYSRLIPSQAQALLGPEFALLRPDFLHWRNQVIQQNKRLKPTIERILVFFGGSDPTGETLGLLPLLSEAWLANYQLDMVVGNSNPAKAEIEAWCQQQPNRHFYCQTPHMAELMANADIAIGAGGTATWERLCLGLPSLVIAVAENQVTISEQVAQAGAHQYLGFSGQVSPAQVAEALQGWLAEPTGRFPVSETAFSLVDGKGTARVCQWLLSRESG